MYNVVGVNHEAQFNMSAASCCNGIKSPSFPALSYCVIDQIRTDL